MKFSTLFISLVLISLSAFAETSGPQVKEPQLILEEIICEGNKKTKCSLIKKQIRLKPSDFIKQGELKNSKIRINLLGLFESVDLSLEKGSEKGKVNLKVEVVEASSYYTLTGLQFGSRKNNWTSGSAEFTIGSRNLLGKGKRLALTYSTDAYERMGPKGSSAFNRARINYIDPNLFGSKKFFGSLDFSTGKDNFRSGKTEYYSANAEIGYRIRKFSYLIIGYGKIKSKHNSDEDDSTDQYRQEDFILGYGFNTQDDAYFPTRGSRFDLKLAFNSSGTTSFTAPGFYNGGTFSDLDWRTTWGLGRNYYLTGFAESRSFDDSEEFLNSGIGLEIAKQVRTNRKDKDISDARFYVAPSISSYDGFDGTVYSAAAGVKFRSKKYGLARFELFYRGDSND